MKRNQRQVQSGPQGADSISSNERRHAGRYLGPTAQSAVDRERGAGARGGGAAASARLVLPTHRTIMVRESEWHSGTGMRIPRDEMTALLRRLRTRDVCLLLMLGQHHYLTTDLLQSLFFPSLRYTRMRLRWLTESRRLLVRYRQQEPRNQGWRRRFSLFLLSERGAVVLARATKADARPVVKRSWYAAEYVLQLGHDLEVNAFFTGLATRSRDLDDQGLYHWVGQDSLRREYQEEGVDLAPDGWGRYLTPHGEVLFNLEWDLGTESFKRLVAKVEAYADYAASRPGGDLNHILFVGTGRVREQTIRAAIARAASPGVAMPFATTHLDLLQERGHLGAIWLGQDAAASRLSLPELPAAHRTGRLVDDCVGKPGWWERRPGAGEGA
jgi:hypothetical protein